MHALCTWSILKSLFVAKIGTYVCICTSLPAAPVLSMDFSKKDEEDVYLFLVEQGVKESAAQVIQDQDIDGQSFLELTLDDLRSLFPSSLGTAKKVYRLIQSQLALGNEPPQEHPQMSSPLSFVGAEQEHDTVSLSSSASASLSVGASEGDRPKFKVPDSWRPSIMAIIKLDDNAQQRRKLTPDIRNAIIRDLVSTVYAHTSDPNKAFCTTVAKALVRKYPFMKDVGTNVSGYGTWEKKLIERVHNCNATRNKGESSDESAPPAKRGRPKSKDAILSRYPPLQEVSDDESDSEEQALKLELEKENPRKDVVIPLLKKTFPKRRLYIVGNDPPVSQLCEQYKAFKYSYALEQEIDNILKKRDVVKSASEEWLSKWGPSVIQYAATLKSKHVKNALSALKTKFKGDDEEDEKKAVYLMMVLLYKGNGPDCFKHLLTEHTMAESPTDIAANVTSKFPLLICVVGDDSNEYFISVERKVLVGKVKSLCKALALWFSVHYVFNIKYDDVIQDFALFYQEFVVGLPAPKVKKTVTYLTVTGDVQNFTEQ